MRSIGIIFCQMCITFSTQQSNSSEIKVCLEGFQKRDSAEWTHTMDSANDYSNLIKITGEDFSIIENKTVFYISIVCKAPYPIYWEMTDVMPRNLKGASTNFRVVFNEDNDDLVAKEFQSYLVLGNGASLTGNYTCRSVQDETKRKSVYVFFPGWGPKNDRHLVYSNNTAAIVGFNKGESVVLPCKTTSKDTIVKLLKKQEDGNWTLVLKNIEFNPKLGFTLSRGESPPQDKPGLYKCHVDLSGEEIIIEVREEYTKVKTQFQSLNFTPGDAIRWSRRKYDDIKLQLSCCSNTTTPPDLVVIVCLNKPHCDMVKQTFLQLSPVTSRTRGVVKTRSSQIMKPNCAHTFENLHQQPILIQCIGDGVNLTGEYMPSLLPPKKESVHYSELPENSVYSYEKTIRMRVMKISDKKAKFRWEPIRFDQVDTLNDLVDGHQYVFDCCGLTHHHASGRILRVVWKNGTITLLPNPELAEKSIWSPFPEDFCSFYLFKSNLEDYYFTTVHLNMSYFECIVPRWYDSKPSIQRVTLNVREPEEPAMANNETVNIIYDANQLGMLQLVCELSQGCPLPKISWTKDGKKTHPFGKYWSILPTEGEPYPKSILLFMRAVKEIEGEYKCQAENKYGSTEKTFIVTVKRRSYVDYWVAFGLFGGFFLLIVCCAMRITKNEKQNPKDV